MSTNAWEQAKTLAEKHAASGGIFVKLQKDGDAARGAFVGEPWVREVCWSGERYEPYDDAKHKGKRPTLRLAINFYMPADDGAGVVKVIEFSSMAVKDLLKLRDKYGFDDWLFEVERQGGPNDPKTRFRILPDNKLTPEQRDEIAELERHDLRSLLSGGDEDEPAPAKRGTANDATISDEVARELMAQLKPLPREQVDAFLKRFGVARLRDVKARDQKAAFAFIESLHPKTDALGDEVDPWV